MKKALTIIFLTLIAYTLQAQHITPAHMQRARQLTAQMTLREKIDYLGGLTSFSLRGMPRLGIPEILLADGPVGIRNHAPHSTLYPASILTAATWNRGLVNRLGSSLGDDARARGVGILLGPGVNIYRSPLCGRNYEYFGEDPYLTGEVARHYILGVQSRGVIATVKHFAGNNQEWSRHHVSSNIDERTLFEIYFPAFAKSVREGHVGAVMDSYNLLNGVHSTENGLLNQEVLRRRWGFNGIVMSDWTSVYSGIAAANGGLDLEMPKARNMNWETLKPAIDNGVVDEQTINAKVQHILQTIIAFGLLDRQQKDSTLALDQPSSRETALDLAREGIVLLKNEGKELPLKGQVAIMGPNAAEVTTGGGSGNVIPFLGKVLSDEMHRLLPDALLLTDDVIYNDISNDIYADSALKVRGFQGSYYKNKSLSGIAGITRIDPTISFDWGYGAPAEGFPTDTFSIAWQGYYRAQVDETIKLYIGGDDGYRVRVNGKTVAADWGNHSYSFREIGLDLKAGRLYHISIDYFDNISSANIKLSLKRLDAVKMRAGLAKASHVVYCGGFNSSIEGEGFDRPFELPVYQRNMIHAVSEINPHLTVVLNAGGGVEMASWKDKAKAIVMAWYAGQEGGQALAEILCGKLSPSGKLPISIETKWEDNPCFGNYYENIKGREVKTVEYREGIFVGYRGYDRSSVKPLFPFGYGLSYSSFEYSDLRLKRTGNKIVEVNFTVTNTGDMEASEIAEVYVKDNVSSVARPEKELKGFEKVRLSPGEHQRIKITLREDAFSYYNLHRQQFVVEPGTFTIMVGGSSDNLPLRKEVRL